MKTEFKPGDKVKPATDTDAFTIGQGFVRRVDKRTIFEVMLVVHKADTKSANKESGLIVKLDIHGRDSIGYPYVWNFNRFVKA